MAWKLSLNFRGANVAVLSSRANWLNKNAPPIGPGRSFFMAGGHKWLFGPRGTGIVARTRRAWESVLPTIPSFIDGATWQAWFSGNEPAAPNTGNRMTPGGYKAFEHLWALTQAFEFHQQVGKARVAERAHELAGQLKGGLSAMPHVSASLRQAVGRHRIFHVEGLPAAAVVTRLRERLIIASVAPYSVPQVRLTPSVQNTPAKIEYVLQKVRALVN